jgi:hypothetical protein
MTVGVMGESVGHLVTITSQEEQDALYLFFGSSLQGKWYGGFQPPDALSADEGWQWVTGETWDYTNWDPLEPNDNAGPGSEQHLVGWQDGQAWNDEGNIGNVTGYVVEYEADALLTGKANFGFVCKYTNDADVPDGHTEFQFKEGALNFSSHSYGWLDVAASKAKCQGIGTINGVGDYHFLLTAIDGDIDPADPFSSDRFRIRIWEETGGGEFVVYDNGLGLDDEADPESATTELGGGSIVVHKAK